MLSVSVAPYSATNAGPAQTLLTIVIIIVIIVIIVILILTMIISL